MTTLTIKYQHRNPAEQIRLTATHIWKLIKLFRERAHQRRQLAALETGQLLDMGITLEAALEESLKPFWKP